MSKISSDLFYKKISSKKNFQEKGFSQQVDSFKLKGSTFYSINKNSFHYLINKKIENLITNYEDVNLSSVGFRKNYCYLDFLTPHVNSYFFIRLDIKNFFHSFPESEIINFLKYFFPDEKDSDVNPYEIAFSAITYKIDGGLDKGGEFNCLPKGFPTSPIISNILFRRIDLLIQKYCDKKKIKYTRYADDMLFSSEISSFIHDAAFEKEISILVSTLKLKLNKKKTKKATHTISLNGYTIESLKKKVNDIAFNSNGNSGSIRISNKKLRPIRKMIDYNLKNKPKVVLFKKIFDLNIKDIYKKYPSEKFVRKFMHDQFRMKAIGYRSYLISFIRYNNLNPVIDNKEINKYRKIIFDIEKAIK